MTPEAEQLRVVLDGSRASVLRKLAALSDEDARRSTVDSGTNLAGLVQHLTFVESMWFEETARHAGHADIMREQIDGQTGR